MASNSFSFSVSALRRSRVPSQSAAVKSRVARHIGGEARGKSAVDAFRGQSRSPTAAADRLSERLLSWRGGLAFAFGSNNLLLITAARRRLSPRRGSGSTIPRRARSARIRASADRWAARNPWVAGAPPIWRRRSRRRCAPGTRPAPALAEPAASSGRARSGRWSWHRAGCRG